MKPSVIEPSVIDWLLDGDPAIRWQVLRDLADAPPERWRSEQERIGQEGWGADLLARRDGDGRWAGGLYSPKWISTTYTLLLLWRMGLSRSHPAAVASTRLLTDRPVWVFGRSDKSYWEACVAGFGLSLASWFADDFGPPENLVTEILDAQMEDGAWNCRRPRGATHSSFHTTINVLEGLGQYRAVGGPLSEATEKAEESGREFLCDHALYRSHRTGEVVDPRMGRLPFPPRWHHNILRGLDYFQAAGAPPDPRLAEPVSVLLGYRRNDGRWPVHAGYSGKVWFAMESGPGPSRWNTLRALRVLRWWEERHG